MIIWFVPLLAASQAIGELPPCSAVTAVETSIQAIHVNSEQYMGRCVTVTGLADALSIYSSEDDNLRLGVYADGFRSTKLHEYDGFWTITGTVDHCSAMRERAQGELDQQEAKNGAAALVMMTGYCHYKDGAVIDAVFFHRVEPETSDE